MADQRHNRWKIILHDAGISQRDIAREIGISPAAVNDIVLYDKWPKTMDDAVLKRKIRKFLRSRDVQENRVRHLFRPSRDGEKQRKKEEKSMLIQFQTLLANTRRHFRLPSDPFHDEMHGPDDVYLDADLRYVREAMWAKTQTGGLLAVVGESGSGKTTLVRDLKHRIVESKRSIRVIEPYVLAMESSDKKGKTLKSSHIVEAILTTVAQPETVASSPEARFRQMHNALKDSHVAGFKHLVIIEEAHSLPTATLKHLKRFLDLDAGDGFSSLLTMLLIGQPELYKRLSASNYAVREVTQRCEIVSLMPLDDSLGDYLAFKVARAGADLAKLITADGVEALRNRLTGQAAHSGAAGRSSVHPLVVNNLVTAALNLAADIGAPIITPEIVKQV
jgi:type II secretory pathway predicted ATPase ExeA